MRHTLHEGQGSAGLNKENLKLNLAGLKPGKAKLVLVATKEGKEIARKEIEVGRESGKFLIKFSNNLNLE